MIGGRILGEMLNAEYGLDEDMDELSSRATDGKGNLK